MLESTLDTIPHNFRNISKKVKRTLSLGHFKCDSILIFLLFSLFLRKGRRNNNIIFSKEQAERCYWQASILP